jgi:hypothetical protein
MTAKIKAHMRSLLRQGRCIDRTTGIANLTELAEETAIDLGHAEWLDDECHSVWDLAIDVAESEGFAE